MRRRSLLASTSSIAGLSGCLGLSDRAAAHVVTTEIVDRECDAQETNHADVAFRDSETIRIDGTISPSRHCSDVDVSPMTSKAEEQSGTTIVRIDTAAPTTCQDCSGVPTTNYRTVLKYPNGVSEVQVDHVIEDERVVPATVERR